MWNKKVVYALNCLKFLRQCPKTIQGRTHLNKIKKPCWRQLPISKSLLLKARRGNNSTSSFNFVYQKGCSQYQSKKVNSAIEFCIFKLVCVPNFSLNRQFWFFGPNLPQKGVSPLKRKIWTPPMNSAFSY